MSQLLLFYFVWLLFFLMSEGISISDVEIFHLSQFFFKLSLNLCMCKMIIANRYFFKAYIFIKT